jgi:hypothetical protein
MNKRPGQSVLEDVYLYNPKLAVLVFLFLLLHVRKMCIKCEQIH